MPSDLGALGNVAGAMHRMSKVNARVETATAGVKSAQTPAALATASKSLSAAQFAQKTGAMHTAGDVADAASSTTERSGGMPDIGDPAWSSPNSIGTGRYS